MVDGLIALVLAVGAIVLLSTWMLGPKVLIAWALALAIGVLLFGLVGGE